MNAPYKPTGEAIRFRVNCTADGDDALLVFGSGRVSTDATLLADILATIGDLRGRYFLAGMALAQNAARGGGTS